MCRFYGRLLKMGGLQDTAVHNLDEDYEGLSTEVGLDVGCRRTQNIYTAKCCTLTEILHSPSADILCSGPADCLQNKFKLC